MIFCFIFSTASSPILIPLGSDEEEYYDELEYVNPYEGEGPHSSTPPPSCDGTKEHKVCVPPAWGEEIPGALVSCRCLLCHEEGRHHAIRCVQCLNAPGCCTCIWGYMRSRYNSGCPLCRAGDPCGEDPLADNQRRVLAVRPRDRHSMVLRRRRGGRRGRGEGRGATRGRRPLGALHCGIGRGTTIEGEEEKRREKRKRRRNRRKKRRLHPF